MVGSELMEENKMKREVLSLRRRHLMIASLLGAAAPGAIFADQSRVADGSRVAEAYAASFQAGEKLVVSGRVVGADCKPVADALVEVRTARAPADRITVRTDADGRFMLITVVPARTDAAYLNYSVSHPEHVTRGARLHFARARAILDDAATQLQRDDAGVWRTTFGVSLV
jgi:protocatechuate 3,4-dioxygenase beta subunit